MNVREEENQAWKDRINKIYQSVERQNIIYRNTYLYNNLYYDNHFNSPDSCGLNYGDYDYSDYPEERAWYWKRWW